MKQLLLVALILPLVIAIDYEFGDIIAFPRQKCSCEEPIYYHYAIYVGKQPIDGKQPGQDIFHHSVNGNGIKFNTVSECDSRFYEIQCWSVQPKLKLHVNLEDSAMNQNTGKDNYRDGKDFRVDQEAIFNRILKMTNKENCRQYHLTKNNCEHLATYVRYGDPHAEQRGTFGETLKKCFLGRRKRSEPQYKISLDYKGVSCEELCKQGGSKKSG